MVCTYVGAESLDNYFVISVITTQKQSCLKHYIAYKTSNLKYLFIQHLQNPYFISGLEFA